MKILIILSVVFLLSLLGLSFETTFAQYYDGAPVRIGTYLAELELLESSYSPIGTATIRVTDTDMNQNNGAIDSVFVKVYSDSDSDGKLVKLTEIGNSVGIFQGDISFSTIPTDGKLLVSMGDMVTAQFEDTTLPKLLIEFYEEMNEDVDSLTVSVDAEIVGIMKINTQKVIIGKYIPGEIVTLSGKFDTIHFVNNINTQKAFFTVTDPYGNEQELSANVPTGIFSLVLNVDNMWIPGTYTVDLFHINEKVDTVSFVVEEEKIISKIVPKTIPDWIKNNAKWWADGSIDDSSFTQGLQYLIIEKIINVESKSQKFGESKEIPSWIKKYAKWWADDDIDEKTFLTGIEYMVREGIISVN